MFKTFSRRFFISTEIINLVFLIPFAFWFVVSFIDPTPNQLKAIIGGAIASFIVAQILQILVSIQLKPIQLYLDLRDKKEPFSHEVYGAARNRLASLPKRVALIGFIRWTVSSSVASIPFYLSSETSVSQTLNFAGIVLFVAILSILISFISATINTRFLFQEGVFHTPYDYKGEHSYQSLKTSLPIVISSLFQLLLIGLVLISFNSMKSAIDVSYKNQLYNINLNNSVHVSRFFKAREDSILNFTKNPKIKKLAESKNWKEMSSELERVYTDPSGFYENAFVASAEAPYPVVATGIASGQSLGIRLDREDSHENVKQALSGKLHFSPTFPSPLDGSSVVLVTAPIFSESGKIIAIAGFPFLVGDYVKQSVGELKLGVNGYSFILDRNMVSIWHPNPKYTLFDFSKVDIGGEIAKKEPETLIRYQWDGAAKGMLVRYNEDYQFYFATTLGVDDIEKVAVRSLINLSIISMVSSILINLFVIFILRSRLAGLDSVGAILGRLQKGDLTTKANIDAMDEFGKMQEGLNDTIDQISDVVGSNQLFSEDLASSAEEMSISLGSLSANAQTQAAAAEEISASIEEISAAVQNVDGQAENQFQKVEFLKKQMSELSHIIESMNKQAVRASSDVKDITDEAKAGQTSLDSMRNSISKISNSSQEIGSVIEIINNISEQINLLALNAAIEAARAGTYGRGFAVVADEIGKLADKTATSIKDIDELIQANEKEINNGTETIETTISLIQRIIQGVNSFHQMTESIETNTKEQLVINNKVSDEVEKVNQISRGIKLSMEEQKNAIGEVAQAIFSINDLTQSTAAGLEEMTATSNGIANLAETLKKKINFFKLNHTVSLPKR
ncbi:methyl-accepting chemotaxis protein [Leptospira idonii]|uniref:Methyl-accepting chemotaxis protein n=1 Tax=Leptospira idonii TaxID=1193500 RepID=A0A4R9LYY6_9LEPT|nr:methyl-accepting chemotaxis protein [Leptospira idonii]TGN19563.1 methyl-accepting chemotaxis protein [Leptospira idonii]